MMYCSGLTVQQLSALTQTKAEDTLPVASGTASV